MLIDLDDLQTLLSLDTAGLLETLRGLPERCADAFALADGVLPRLDDAARPKQIVFCGAGVAGLAADFAQALLADTSDIPIFVARGYTLPAWVGPDTLAVAISDTGATEETVYAVSEATDKQARRLAVTGGGHLQDIAEANEFPLVLVPRVVTPEPLALGPLFFALWGALHSLGLLPDGTARRDIVETLGLLRRQRDAFAPEAPTAQNAPKQLAQALDGTVPVIYGSPGIISAAARRWKFACNAVAGMPAFWNSSLDADRDDVRGWLGPAESGLVRAYPHFSIVLLRDRADSSLIAQRVDTVREQIAEADPSLPVHEIAADGESALARLWTAAFLGDWAAAYLAVQVAAG